MRNDEDAREGTPPHKRKHLGAASRELGRGLSWPSRRRPGVVVGSDIPSGVKTRVVESCESEGAALVRGQACVLLTQRLDDTDGGATCPGVKHAVNNCLRSLKRASEGADENSLQLYATAQRR